MTFEEYTPEQRRRVRLYAKRSPGLTVRTCRESGLYHGEVMMRAVMVRPTFETEPYDRLRDYWHYAGLVADLDAEGRMS